MARFAVQAFVFRQKICLKISDEWNLIRDMAVNQKIQEDYIKLLEETLDMNEKSCNKVRLE